MQRPWHYIVHRDELRLYEISRQLESIDDALIEFSTKYGWELAFNMDYNASRVLRRGRAPMRTIQIGPDGDWRQLELKKDLPFTLRITSGYRTCDKRLFYREADLVASRPLSVIQASITDLLGQAARIHDFWTIPDSSLEAVAPTRDSGWEVSGQTHLPAMLTAFTERLERTALDLLAEVDERPLPSTAAETPTVASPGPELRQAGLRDPCQGLVRFVRNTGFGKWPSHVLCVLDARVWEQYPLLVWGAEQKSRQRSFHLRVGVDPSSGALAVISMSFTGRGLDSGFTPPRPATLVPAVPLFDTTIWGEGDDFADSGWSPAYCWTTKDEILIYFRNHMRDVSNEYALDSRMSALFDRGGVFIGFRCSELSPVEQRLLHLGEASALYDATR